MPGSTSSSSRQSNGVPRPPGRVASRGARASKMMLVRHICIKPDGRQRGPILDRQGLHHRQPEARAHGDDTLRRLVAVQLQHVRTHRLDDLAQHLVGRIDGERDLVRAALHPLAERARRAIGEVARRGSKEDKADLIGPSVQRHVERFGAHQAADFHQKGHVFRIRPDRTGSNPVEAFCLVRAKAGDNALFGRRMQPDGDRRVPPVEFQPQLLILFLRPPRRPSASAACRSQAATPPKSTPKITSTRISTKSGSEAA